MKNLLSATSIFLLFLLGVSACYQAPEFPVKPEINFQGITFYDTPNPLDSLVVTIGFQDGDGDLGLYGDEYTPPYQLFSFIIDAEGNPLTISSNDTMPPYTSPYSCINYKVGKVYSGQFVYYSTTPNSSYQQLFADNSPDTLYSKPNIYTDNFLVDFLVKENGNFEVFNWITAPSSGCGESLNGRFNPLFDADNPNKPLSGTITYSMENRGFVPYFRNDTLKLRIRIIDRSQNISNVIETPEFTLESIQAGQD